MFLRDFFHGSGRIVLKEKFVSLRLVREALERKFTIRILEETPSRLRCKVVRFTRLYGAPVPFPNPSLEVTFKNDRAESLINYNVTIYDYYTLIIVALLSGILSARHWRNEGLMNAIREGSLFAAVALLFFGTFVFIDTRFLVCRIRKALSNVG